MKERLKILPSLSISQSFYIKVVRAFKRGLSITKVHETIGLKQKYSKSNIISIRNYAINIGDLERDPATVASWETKRKKNKQMSLFSKKALSNRSINETSIVETVGNVGNVQPEPAVTHNTPLNNLQIQETPEVTTEVTMPIVQTPTMNEDELKGVFRSTAEYNTKRRSETANILTIDFKGILVQIENSSNIIVTEDRITVK